MNAKKENNMYASTMYETFGTGHYCSELLLQLRERGVDWSTALVHTLLRVFFVCFDLSEASRPTSKSVSLQFSVLGINIGKASS